MRRGPTRVLLPLLLALLVCLPDGTQAASKKKKRRAKAKETPVSFDKNLPVLSTRLAPFPPGEGKAIADQACLNCHSTDVVRQQRLTEKQWTASVTKMVGWGAEVPESKRDALIAYLVKNFGPDNDRFEPVITRPVGR
ncbi:MAG TPA: cytochrome c [Thermoanaerobaculia bacterium]